MNKLKELREDNDVSINRILKLLNVSRTTYYNYENELSYPPFSILFILSDFYGVSIDYLLGHKVNNNDYSLSEYIKKTNLDIILNSKEKETLKVIIDSFIKNKK